ncbi:MULTISPECIES: hypothetical protein [Flavobacterium]|uniref:Lipoprotein n=1 Tax=Flavobacterium jumunjinense TaxID=998845 RepID=A0ABV5GLC1_9FLAO|nr:MULTISPECIES: hypothetical protein [Flavobacterium]
MKNNIKCTILFLLFVLFNSCATSDSTIYADTKVVAVNVKLDKGNWLVDDPIVHNISKSFISTTIEHYKKELQKDTKTLKSISDFNNMATLNEVLKKDTNVLSFYKEQTNCDYLIETEINLVKKELPKLQLYPDKSLENILVATITVYDLNKRVVVFERYYQGIDKIVGNNDVAVSTKLDRFIDDAIHKMVKDFRAKYNWVYIDSSVN